MPTKISSDAATTSAKVFSCLPCLVGGLMLAAAVYHKEIGILGAAAALALLVALAWVAWRFV